MTNKQKVFITRKIPDIGIKMLKKHFDITINQEDRQLTKKELIEGVKGKDALLSLLTDPIDKDVVDANPNLKIIANYAVGYNNIDLTATKDIIVTNTPGVLTDAVAEHTVSLLLSIAKRIPEADKFTREGKFQGWAPLFFLDTEVTGKTIGIVGLGRIGTRVAEILYKGFNMKIFYYDPSKNKQFEKKFKAKYLPMKEILKKSDFVSLHVPLTPETKHLISKKEFSLMKKTAFLINTSRGPVVDEEALIDALKNNKIAGAALDVFECEPDIVCNPNNYTIFKNLQNIIVTPHTASATIEARSKMAEIVAQNIINVLKGKKPLTPVKKS